MVRRKAELLDLLRQQETRSRGGTREAPPPARPRKAVKPVAPAPRSLAKGPASLRVPGRLPGGPWVLFGGLGLLAVVLVWWLASLFSGGDPEPAAAGPGGGTVREAAAPGAGAGRRAGVYAVRLAVYPLTAEDRATQVLGWLRREGWPEAVLLKVDRGEGPRLELYVGVGEGRDDPELATLLGRLRELTIPGHPEDAEPPFATAFIVQRPQIQRRS